MSWLGGDNDGYGQRLLFRTLAISVRQSEEKIHSSRVSKSDMLVLSQGLAITNSAGLLSALDTLSHWWYAERIAEGDSAKSWLDQLEYLSLDEGKAYNDRLKPLCRGDVLPNRSDPVEWIMFDLWESMRATDVVLASGIINPLLRFMDAQTS